MPMPSLIPLVLLLLFLLLSSVDSLSLLSWSRMSLVLVGLLVTSFQLFLSLSRVSSLAGERSLAHRTCVTKLQVPREMGTASRAPCREGSSVPPLPPLLHQGAFLLPHLFRRAHLCRNPDMEFVTDAWTLSV